MNEVKEVNEVKIDGQRFCVELAARWCEGLPRCRPDRTVQVNGGHDDYRDYVGISKAGSCARRICIEGFPFAPITPPSLTSLTVFHDGHLLEAPLELGFHELFQIGRRLLEGGAGDENLLVQDLLLGGAETLGAPEQQEIHAPAGDGELRDVTVKPLKVAVAHLAPVPKTALAREEGV